MMTQFSITRNKQKLRAEILDITAYNFDRCGPAGISFEKDADLSEPRGESGGRPHDATDHRQKDNESGERHRQNHVPPSS
jgi:hypothetical protein